MRIITKALYDTVQTRIADTSSDLNDAAEIVTNGRKFDTLSDDPFRVTEILNNRVDIEDIEQLESNIDMAESWLSNSEIALRSVESRLVDARTNATQMINASNNADDRNIAAAEVNEFLKDVLDLANRSVNGQYVFGGSKTDEPPFQFVNDAGEVVTVDEATHVEYLGDRNPFAVKTDTSKTIEVGHDGDDVFRESFENLLELRDALKNNDVETISKQIDELKDDAEHISSFVSGAGYKLNRLEFRRTILEDSKMADLEKRADLEEADIAEAITDLSIAENAYKASLASSTKILGMKSLMDYL
ncbi:flagellar hook-associated protein 3 FlgL [Candidatus Magnetomoraceae bacterium gMMP-15]